MADMHNSSRFPSRWLASMLVLVPAAYGQLSSTDIESLQMEAQTEGWTFEVGANPATYRDLGALANLEPPVDWQATGRMNPLMAEPSGSVVLPAAWDWREHSGCTPIRNQAGCGSCWAFATVGILEGAIMIDSGQSVDLSEQYLVSCNRSSWSCAGGWFAHDYHYNVAGKSGGVGAILESAKPYTATNALCGGPFTHPYTINRWYYVDTLNAIPSVAAIKQAIYDYGPISVAVTVTNAFQAYHSGVFNVNSTAAINHAVVLVGWNDADQAWILRNSWGTYWGESGYMRIAYGCSKVGYGACYVDYGSGEPQGARITTPAPGSTLDSDTATFEWTGVEGATEYWLGIGETIGKMNLYSASQGTNTSATFDRLPVAGKPVYVKLFTNIGGKWYGQLHTYTAANIPAANAAMESPTPSSTLESSTATFTWSTGSRVTGYGLWVGTVAGGYNLYKNTSLGMAQSATVTNLPAGGRTIYVRLFSKIAGIWKQTDYTYTGPASDPAAAVLESPADSSTLDSSTATFSWSEGLGVSEYMLQLGTSLGAQNVYKKSQGKNRSVKLGGLPTTGATLYVRLYSKCAGVWQYHDYTVTTANLSVEAASMTGPTDAATFESNIVTFTWDDGVGATQYRLDVGTSLGLANLYNQVQGLNKTVTLRNMPVNGCRVYVRLWSLIRGVWQKRSYTYTAATLSVAAAEITSPEPGSKLTSSLVEFEWSAGVAISEYWLAIGTVYGGNNLYNKSQGLNTSVTVSNLPVNGSNLYVRLTSKINGVWQRRDCTYRASGSGSARLIP